MNQVVPEDGDDDDDTSVYQAQFVEEMKLKGIVPPRSVAKGSATDRRLLVAQVLGNRVT